MSRAWTSIGRSWKHRTSYRRRIDTMKAVLAAG
jgi:hypothetical protein